MAFNYLKTVDKLSNTFIFLILTFFPDKTINYRFHYSCIVKCDTGLCFYNNLC